MQSSVDTYSHLPSGASVADVLSSWVDRPGYPVVTVTRDYETDTASLTQERFLLHTPSGSADLDAAWWVPVSMATRFEYTDEYTTTPIHGWIQPSGNLTVSLPDQSAPQWLLVNLDRKGNRQGDREPRPFCVYVPPNGQFCHRRILPCQLRHEELAAARQVHGRAWPAHGP